MGAALLPRKAAARASKMNLDEKERREAFQDALARLVNQYSLEFDMSVCDITNALRQEEFRLMAQLHRLKQWKDGE